MTQRTIYECDRCGNRFGARNDVVPMHIRRKNSEWIPYSDEKLHVCHDCGGEHFGAVNNSRIGRLLVNEDRTVIGFLDDLRAVVYLDDYQPPSGDPKEALYETIQIVEEMLD